MTRITNLSGVAFLALASVAMGEDPAPPHGPVPPAQAAARMTLPEGFKATLFASEPEVVQPIAFTIDPKGRLWVVECYSYPVWLGGPQGRDRILILEDTDGDGRHDKRTVFWDKGSNLTGIALGFGGVWVCSTPNLLFLPDADGNDVPDGEPVVKLDGWDVKAQHNMFNALNWGPDGWLWGCNGIMSNSNVGKPGTPDSDRVAINCGVWRYHPTRGVFEAVAHGTTNPWGLDFDDFGEAFITNCVIPHLFRVVPGSRHQRMFGQDFQKHSYELLTSCADHIHWAGGNWTDSRGGVGKHGEAGGGHAHAGAMVYLGDNWPSSYRNGLFTANIHGHRINHDTLERTGSGYVAKHAKDFLMANDDWFRGLELKYGPDGSVFMTDWSDMGECHETDADNAHRENGRIYKVTYGSPAAASVDLATLPDADLVSLQTHNNDWYVRTARRLLQERAAAGKSMEDAHAGLGQILKTDPAVTHKLRALWALHASGGTNPESLRALFDHPSEQVRSWAIRLSGDSAEPDAPTLAAITKLAKDDPSPLVRLSLASLLQKVSVGRRWEVAQGLLSHAEDAGDATLPLMIWYAVEPLIPSNRERGVSLAIDARIPQVRRFVARRAALADDELTEKRDETPSAGVAALTAALGRTESVEVRRDLLAGMLEAYRGRKQVAPPSGWSAVASKLADSGDADLRLRSVQLSLLFGEARAAEQLQAILADKANPFDVRTLALQSLVEARVPDMAARLIGLLDDTSIRGPVLRALAAFPDPSIAQALVNRYGSFTPSEREDAVNTLASRPDHAMRLLAAIGDGAISPRDLSATTARQIQALGKPEIDRALERVWGASRPTSGEKAQLSAKYKALLGSSTARKADASRGRAVFNRSCVQCHKLFDQGGDVGPELTGSDRANPDYVLENVLDPSATVGRDYRLTTVATIDGRLVSGIVRAQSEKTLTIQTVNERVTLPREEIEEFKETNVSMMPEGILEKLSEEEIRDLIAYLASKVQVPEPTSAP